MTADGGVSEEGREPSRIPIAYLILGYENNRKAIIDFYRNAKHFVNWVTDENHPKVESQIDWLEKEIDTARRRGIKCKIITDITRDNVIRCKRLMNRTDEIRHLDGISVNFGVSDTEVVAMTIPSSLPTAESRNIQFMQSDSESVREYKQLLFDMLWTRGTPSKLRFERLEGEKIKDNRFVNEMKSFEGIQPRRSKVIDRIYACEVCYEIFVFAQEVQLHTKTSGHESFREFPLT
jgi:hypothetical protein